MLNYKLSTDNKIKNKSKERTGGNEAAENELLQVEKRSFDHNRNTERKKINAKDDAQVKLHVIQIGVINRFS